LHMDAKMVLSRDGGKTWDTQATTVYGEAHRAYLPWLVPLGKGQFAANWICFDKGMMMRLGNIVR